MLPLRRRARPAGRRCRFPSRRRRAARRTPGAMTSAPRRRAVSPAASTHALRVVRASEARRDSNPALTALSHLSADLAVQLPPSRAAMASPLGHALAVRVEDGRAFPRDGGAAFRVVATFDEEPRTTVRHACAYRVCALR